MIWCISCGKDLLRIIMIFKCILNLNRNVNKVDCTVWPALVMSWWSPDLCWKITNKRKNLDSSITLHLKMNANLAALFKLPHSSVHIRTESCRKWKPGDALSLLVWIEEEQKGEKEWKHDHFLWRYSQNALFLAKVCDCSVMGLSAVNKQRLNRGTMKHSYVLRELEQ